MITIIAMGTDKKEIPFENGMNVGVALEKAKVALPKKFTLTVNGVEAKEKTELKDGDILVVTPKVKNGSKTTK